ncbi:hypothetical protein [Candidatus Enterococcus murrayae]|uniref:Cell division protein n=1 Tax=Candidatus Enterococcus murrayae TaxID=2815321 RepID=A0ABS3HLR2_9ENTE|nr:hypothetical protein [Enterococcus sp. MJM16]MBO0454390.1 hypothetical protein [Enterococcus sp. MJM16]
MKRYRYYLIILVIAGLFVVPQIWTQKLILGADALFHYNRFYETAEQMKTGNFSYFISIFGFQQSGRIVNAVYGPLFSYLQGGLVLLAGSWFRYQVLSNFIVLLVAGFSLFKLLTYGKIKENPALFAAIIFMTTYSINYWILNQGFTSWGTSLLPLCLIPLVDLKNGHFPVVKIAASMALMTQVHMLTAVMLGLIYFPFFISYARNRWGEALLDLLKAMGLYGCLSINVWVSLLLINTGDRLKMPFTNPQMSEKAIDLGGAYWLHYPGSLRLLLIIGFLLCLVYWRSVQRFTKQLLIFSGIFLLLSTSIVPWDWLVAHEVPLISLIQFPFRFFAPFTVLFFFFIASLSSELANKKFLPIVLALFSVISIGQNLRILTYDLNQWGQQTLTSKHTFVRASEKEARQSFYDKDMQKALKLVEKSSPDYLPIYHENTKNKYVSYEKQILTPQTNVTKTVKKNQLELSWQAEKTGNVQLPVIVYQNTKIMEGNREVSPVSLSTIGVPTIKQKIGRNTVRLRYDPPGYATVIFALCGLSWFAVLSWWAYRFFMDAG